MIDIHDVCESEWVEWYLMTPRERWAETERLWGIYCSPTVLRVPLIIVLLTVGGLASRGWAQAPLHVSTQGNDAWSGRPDKANGEQTDGPLATLHKAIELTRQAPAGQPRRIVVQEGRYFLEQPIELEPADSELEIKAAEHANVTLYGGRADSQLATRR